jgi:BirA family biotin operon repressor/biotin-[acetyl-CoA-carboxylase] ligase
VPVDDPHDVEHLRRQLLTPGSGWQQLDVVAETGSTNADLAERARAGAAPGTVLLTDHQIAGRGRLGRTWTAPPQSSIAMSLLVAPDVPTPRWTWLPLLAGLAVTEALRRTSAVDAVLKWPNDVLVGGRKICGILAELADTPAGPACVIGVGLNVRLAEAELPVPTATSLALVIPDRVPRRDTVVIAILRAFGTIVDAWRLNGDEAAADHYLHRCVTVGRRVAVLLPDDRTVEGTATGIDPHGRLEVATNGGLQTFGAGDVVHLR